MRPADLSVDDRAVVPETDTEMIHGEFRRVAPAEPPHADRQCDIAYVIRSEVAPGYVAATELLTRVDDESDFATDACVRRAGRDPETGSRYLEELAFEVKHTQSEAELTERARKLIRRGVRRVFVIHVKEERGVLRAGPVKEWQAAEDRWLELSPDAAIADHCFVQPVKVQALINMAEADNQVARALLAQQNPVLVENVARELATRDEAHARELAARDEAHARELEAQARELAEAQQARELEAQARERAEAHARELEAQARELTESHVRALSEVRAREAVLELCDVLDIEVTTERRARMDAMTGNELGALRSAIRAQRCWPG